MKERDNYNDKTIQLIKQFDTLKKSVIVEIATDDLNLLIDANYKLCFAKKIATNDFNVVWQSYDQYWPKNRLSWEPIYQLFASNYFKAGDQVFPNTNIIDIGLYEQSSLVNPGRLTEPVTGGIKNGFTMTNKFRSVHPGVNQLVTSIDGTITSTPIYVKKDIVINGDTTQLIPTEIILVWFATNIVTSTMFNYLSDLNSHSQSIEVDLTATGSIQILYQDQQWQKI
jgi:hypothetical protein